MPGAVAFWATQPSAAGSRRPDGAGPHRTQYYVWFTKLGPARFLSHLDIVRLMERAVRRAGIPMCYTAGFNPRPRMAVLLALPVGVESDEELMTLQLARPLGPAAIQAKLNEALVDGVQVAAVEENDAPAGGNIIAHYQISLPEGLVLGTDAATKLLEQGEVPVELDSPKGRKTVDIRPFLLDLTAEKGKIRYCAMVTPRGTARPDAVLKALLGQDAAKDGRIRIRRTALTFAGNTACG